MDKIRAYVDVSVSGLLVMSQSPDLGITAALARLES